MANRLEQIEATPIRRAREAAGLSRAELAARAQIALSTLGLAEVHGLVSTATAVRLAEALGVDPKALGLRGSHVRVAMK